MKSLLSIKKLANNCRISQKEMETTTSGFLEQNIRGSRYFVEKSTWNIFPKKKKRALEENVLLWTQDLQRKEF